MFDLEQEFDRVRVALGEASIEYALCGGLAVGVYGRARSTIDIDVLIRAEDEQPVYDAVAGLGFRLKARPMNFDAGATQIRRISKVDPADGEVLILDLLLVTPTFQHVWDTRKRRQWKGQDLWVVSTRGLIAMKRARSSPVDLADIEWLENIAPEEE